TIILHSFPTRRSSDLDLLTVAFREESTDGTTKYLFRCTDGETIESVWIPHEDRQTLCVSSQVGCRMGCKFCNTATMGLKRNLTRSEEHTSELQSRGHL